jgi:AbiJ N-terminal domain 5
MAQTDTKTGERLLALRERVVAAFDSGNWEELGLLTGSTALITKHERLLRSLAKSPQTTSPGRCLPSPVW